MTRPNSPQSTKITSRSKRHDPDIMYRLWAETGGKVTEALRRAEERHDDRVPKDRHTWYAYAEKYGFEERMKKEEDERWAQYHAEMKRLAQHAQDRLTHAYVEFSEVFAETIIRDARTIRQGDADPEALRQALKRFNKLFPSIEAANCFYRMSLRSQDLPEHISTQKNETNVNARIVTIEELEIPDHWASSVEEVRKKLEEGKGA